MSNLLSRFKKRSPKKSAPPPPVPRSLEEIQKDHDQVCLRAGAVQYEMGVRKAELESLNQALRRLNFEGAERKKLDEETAPKSEESNNG